jgi:hypothetical protein
MAKQLKDKIIDIGRWIAIVPFGMLCGALVLFPLHWILYFTLVKGEVIEMPIENMAPIERFLSPILSSIIFVYAGAMIAPKKQFAVSIILFAFGLLIRLGIVFFVRQSDMELDTSLYGLSRLLLSALAGGIGVFLVYIKVNKNESLHNQYQSNDMLSYLK